MSASRVTALVEDLRYFDHRGPAGHPECPERLSAVDEATAPRRDRLSVLAPRPATREEILRVHRPDHVDRISQICERAPAHLDADTYVSGESFDIGLLAAGGCVELALAIAANRVQTGLASVRPPGHHAEAGRAMGFCLFNNVAVAARALQAEEGVDRILILDWDVHHGNGTQHSFEEDPTILYVSTHQYPYYPGTGAVSEVGRDRGAGFTLNVPMPAGCGDAEYVGVLQRILVPAAHGFRPDFFLVSCGFDAHRDDPLAGMLVTGDGYAAMAAIARRLADDLCGGRLAFVLEGGYARTGLREGIAAVLDAILDPKAPQPPPAVDLAPGSPLERIVEPVVRMHRDHFPGLGAA